jgi:hypothetical protein
VPVADSFGIALYFALDGYVAKKGTLPCIWVLNAFAMNSKTWFESGVRDVVQPKYLGLVENEFWDYGEMLTSDENWLHDGPVGIYPLQISERMRAQRGWFTIHGNQLTPLEDQCPECVARIILEPSVLSEAWEFLDLAGLKPYAVYPDLDHLGAEVYASATTWIRNQPGPKRRQALRGERRKGGTAGRKRR